MYSPQKWENCPGDMPMSIKMNMPESNVDAINVSGVIMVKEEIHGEVDFSLEASRCSLDMQKCEKYNNVNIKEMCAKFKEKKSIYSSMFAPISPPLSCPIKAGNYSIVGSKIELGFFTMFPLEGYVWVVVFRLVASEKGTKSKRTILCLNSETKIVRAIKKP